MNSSLKAIFLLALVCMSSCDVIQQNLANLKAQMQALSSTASAGFAKIQELESQLQNSQAANNNGSSNSSGQTTPAVSNTTSNPSSPTQNTNTATPAATNNSAPAVANNTTPAAATNTTTPAASNNTNTSSGMSVTLDQLEQIMPNSGNNSAYYLSYLNDAMSAGGINNCPRMAAFLAQIGHESGSLVYTTEIADGSEYEGITDIGNTSPGDGVKYKGRGLIQVTGKYNYQIVGDGLGYDFVSDPTELANVPWCIESAVWWWNNHTLSPIADANTQDSFDQTTRIINGGYNGKADRDSRWATAKQVLGC